MGPDFLRMLLSEGLSSRKQVRLLVARPSPASSEQVRSRLDMSPLTLSSS